MSLIDITPCATTYLCRDDPAEDHSRACALVAATSWQRGMTSAILLTFRRPQFAPGITRAELMLYPWQNRGAELHPAFLVYRVDAYSPGALLAGGRQPDFSDFPQASQPSSACQSDGALHCDITALVKQWLCGGEPQCGIAVVAEPDACLMIHSGCGDHPPRLRLLSADGGDGPALWEGEHSAAGEEDIDPDFCGRPLPWGYQEQRFVLLVDEQTAYTPAVDIAQARTVTFLIKNNSDVMLDAALQVSPNGRDWMDDKQRITVPVHGLAAITPYLFARYIRLGASSPVADICARATVWVQAQTFDCIPVG